MGRKKKLDGLKRIAESLRPVMVPATIPMYASGKDIIEGRIKGLEWDKATIAKLESQRVYKIGMRRIMRPMNHYENLKALTKGMSEAESIKQIDAYVQKYGHAIASETV